MRKNFPDFNKLGDKRQRLPKPMRGTGHSGVATCSGFQASPVASWPLSLRRNSSPQPTMTRLPAIAFTCALLAACVTQNPATEPPVDSAVVPEETSPAPVAERPIPPDSLYPLLVAEFALRQRAYDVALSHYLEQSQLLRDPAVSAHTTHLTQFLQQGSHALQSAQLWVELDPDSIEANHTLAELLIRQGRSVDALPYMAAVEREGGTANFPALMSDYGQLSDDNRQQLAQGILALSGEFPDNPRLLLAEALVHAENLDLDAALSDLDALFELEPEHPQALLLEAKILVELEKKNPFARLDKVLRDNPDAQMLRLQYAGMLAATDMQAAKEQFEVLSAQAPQDADLLFSLALINREIGDYDTASAYMLESIAMGRNKNEGYYYLGRIAEENEQPEQAITYYSMVSEGDEYLAACGRVGQILVAADQLERNHDWFNTQRERHPDLLTQFYGLESDILAEAGYIAEAMTVLNEALAAEPENMPLQYARAMLSEKLDDIDAMERDLRAILENDPDNPTALNALGYTLADRTERYDEAMQLIARALKLRPDEPAILDSMGWVLYRMGNYEESLEYLNRAYAGYPDPEIASHLGEVLWVSGQADAARAIWFEALERDPSHTLLLETLDRLGVDIADTAAGSPGDSE